MIDFKKLKPKFLNFNKSSKTADFTKVFDNINFNTFTSKTFNTPKVDFNSKNKFTPFRRQEKAEEMTAARRFGGRNLQGLQRIGQGRDRTVYALDDDKVLKVAKNPGGLTQNTGERDLVYLGMGEQLEHGKDYVVMKKQRPLSKEGKQKLSLVRKEVDQTTNRGSRSYNTDVAMSLSGDDSVLDQTGIGRDILDFQPNPQEVFANRQWGEDEQGNLVLVDGGALQDSRSLSKFRVKDYKPEDWEYQDWQEVQSQRRQFKDKGAYDKERKFSRGYMEDPEVLQTLPADDEVSKNKSAKQLYNNFIEGLAISEDEQGKPIGIKKAKKMYSFQEYFSGGAYDADLDELEYQELIKKDKQSKNKSEKQRFVRNTYDGRNPTGSNYELYLQVMGENRYTAGFTTPDKEQKLLFVNANLNSEQEAQRLMDEMFDIYIRQKGEDDYYLYDRGSDTRFDTGIEASAQKDLILAREGYSDDRDDDMFITRYDKDFEEERRYNPDTSLDNMRNQEYYDYEPSRRVK